MTNIKKEPTGYVIYRGPSLIDQQPIVVIAITGKSTNKKTGDMVQTYILTDNGRTPVENAQSGADVSVCGNCEHRPIMYTLGEGDGACYVNLGQGARAVHAALIKGNYPADKLAAQRAAAGRMVRLGTYGDPMAVPYYVWLSLILSAAGHTGYSNQWLENNYSDEQRAEIMRLCMASAADSTRADMARSLGLRYFRIRTAAEPLGKKEFKCPASEEAGKVKTCSSCGACDGSAKNTAASPVIIVHGSKKSRVINIALAA